MINFDELKKQIAHAPKNTYYDSKNKSIIIPKKFAKLMFEVLDILNKRKQTMKITTDISKIEEGIIIFKENNKEPIPCKIEETHLKYQFGIDKAEIENFNINKMFNCYCFLKFIEEGQQDIILKIKGSLRDKSIQEIQEIDLQEFDLIYWRDNNLTERYVTYKKTTEENTEETRYYLIENQIQIYKRFKTENFSHCIFLIYADFSGMNFIKSGSFKSSYNKGMIQIIPPESTTKKSSFEESTTEFASFDYAQFHQHITFNNTVFNENISFDYAQFYQHVTFNNTIFKKSVKFFHAQFSSIDMLEAIFHKDAYLPYTIFKYQAIFQRTRFHKSIDFSNAIFEKYLEFTSVQLGCLNLKFAEISKIDYTDTKIKVKNATNRETFLILKNRALDQEDQVKALEFHTHEMEKYREELSWKQVDKWLLFFEKHISYYGANPLKALLWIIIVQTFMIFFLYPLFYSGDLELTEYLTNILGYKFWSNDVLEHLKHSSYFQSNSALSLSSLKFINTIKNIIIAILIYKTIKSFRKFSRKI